jgi:hypothetical protein
MRYQAGGALLADCAQPLCPRPRADTRFARNSRASNAASAKSRYPRFFHPRSRSQQKGWKKQLEKRLFELTSPFFTQCDRNVPCEACIHRGIESECTYLTSPEDRDHISQAEIIDRLRREVAQLRSQLNQSSARGPSHSRREKVYTHKNKMAGLHGSYTAGSASVSGPGSSGSGSGSRSATGSAEPTEAGSWAGSSPSSISTTARTGSVTVTSPDSTGSESGAGGSGFVQQHAYSGPTGPYGTQIAEVDMATTTESAVLGNCMFHLFLMCCFVLFLS